MEVGRELSLDTCQRESLRGFYDGLGAGSRLVRQREDCRIASELFHLSSWAVVVPLVLGNGIDSMGWGGVEAKGLLWRFNFEISFPPQRSGWGWKLKVTTL